jgi:hypothetical protein
MSQVSDPNADAERVDLKSLEVRTESGKIDFDRLKLTLGACARRPRPTSATDSGLFTPS